MTQHNVSPAILKHIDTASADSGFGETGWQKNQRKMSIHVRYTYHPTLTENFWQAVYDRTLGRVR